MVNKITIEEAIKLNQEEIIFIDTRSPKEFEEDNIPGSINIPIFSNEERKIIGTLYKNNQIEAYKEGFAVYNKKISTFLDQFEKFDKSKQIIVYCWRGGMRSKTIADLVETRGFQTLQLEGGYKKFRELIRENLKEYKPPFELIVIQGMAGSGKTDLIKQLEPSIDLEGLAQHRSSLFGALGLKPTSQKMFESRLWYKLQELKNEKTVFIEGEAKKVGDVFVPTKLFEAMEKAKTILIETSIEKRVQIIIRDYFSHEEDEKIKKIINKLKEHLSGKVADELCEFVDKKEYEPVAKTLLVDYYDKQYGHALEEMKYYKNINGDNQNKAIEELNKIKEEI